MLSAPGGFLELFLAAAARDPARVFARFDGGAVSFGALDAASGRLAAGLRTRGIAPGDRVAVMLRNSPDALILLFALAKASAVWVPVNVQLRADGLRYILDHAEPRMVIAEADLLGTLRGCGAALADVMLITPVPAAGAEPLHALEASVTAAAVPAPGDIFAISYTSGTTGPPKGVLVTHRMQRLAGEGAMRTADACDGDVMYVWEPFYHIGGSQLIVVPLLRDVVLHMAPRFSARHFWHDVARAGATHIHYLGGILPILLKQPPGPQDRAHRVRVAWGGGCPTDIWPAVQQRYGVTVRECYGMTEASSFTTFNGDGVVGSVGRPLPWFSVALLDADGQPVPHGQRGEIVVRSADPHAITPGYFRNPDVTARGVRGGALHTGDAGSWDADGNLIFHGRMTDNVRVKGENVSAWEVEHVAAQHPAVEDCAMIGVAADIGEQDIKLLVQPVAGVEIAPAELSAWLGERLAPYQRPRYLTVVTAFARTPSQRIMKHGLSRRVDDCWDRLEPEEGRPGLCPGPAGA